jgi:multicomponent Na+:H+ antiporter subunit D
VGAVSISAFPLFSGFVSKEIVVHAASLDGRATVVWLLKLASIGTFLHTGLKLPWFTWLGPRRNIAVGPVPVSMYVAMALLAALNLAIGIAPGVLYDLLPHPVDYAPYTLARVTDMTNLLLFTAVGFWLLRDRLGGEPTVSVDTDWLYRTAPSRLAAAFQRGPAGRAAPGKVVSRARRAIGVAGPLGFGAPGSPRRTEARGYTGPTWTLGAVVLATFVLTLAVSLLS